GPRVVRVQPVVQAQAGERLVGEDDQPGPRVAEIGHQVEVGPVDDLLATGVDGQPTGEVGHGEPFAAAGHRDAVHPARDVDQPGQPAVGGEPGQRPFPRAHDQAAGGEPQVAHRAVEVGRDDRFATVEVPDRALPAADGEPVTGTGDSQPD